MPSVAQQSAADTQSEKYKARNLSQKKAQGGYWPSGKSLPEKVEGFPTAVSNMDEQLKKAGGLYTVFNAEEPFGPREADAARRKSRKENI